MTTHSYLTSDQRLRTAAERVLRSQHFRIANQHSNEKEIDAQRTRWFIKTRLHIIIDPTWPDITRIYIEASVKHNTVSSPRLRMLETEIIHRISAAIR